MMKEALLELTSDIVAAHVTNNVISADQLPQLVAAVYGSLDKLGQPTAPIEEERTPAVTIRSSVKADTITCLECGAKQKTLKRHLLTQHGLSPEEYRARWKLASDYPMVAPDYAAKRSQMAHSFGLGSKGGRKKNADAPRTSEANAEEQAPTEVKTKTKRKLGIKAG
ncbi:MucR family transcriptional regulator [Novosphingobium sp. KA1]|uniref:MucR family transcriptional regulator n=1 Tax=Novosphingobium sp. (strain KA1) TaxID=164608 RepID=UPI001A8FA73A|nr:MucR family transcriptional regulator [Novosphingobium sp. KA1]QSR19307.1 MucR family transcriptional regulator [Novosphingobium sp. KA1]